MAIFLFKSDYNGPAKGMILQSTCGTQTIEVVDFVVDVTHGKVSVLYLHKMTNNNHSHLHSRTESDFNSLVLEGHFVVAILDRETYHEFIMN